METGKQLLSVFTLPVVQCTYDVSACHTKTDDEVTCSADLSFFLLALSGGDPEHQLRGDGAQFPVSTSPAPRLQAVLCVPGQILGVPLWCQLLRGLQGEKNLSGASEAYGVWIYRKQVARTAEGSIAMRDSDSFCKCRSLRWNVLRMVQD